MPGIDGNTQLCLHMDGSDNGTTFTDSSQNGYSTSVISSAVTHSTSFTAPKFGVSSGKFAGSSYIEFADTANLRPGSGDFTYDWWQYLQTQPTNYGPFGKGSFGANDINVQSSGNKYLVWFGGSTLFTQATAHTLNAWQHFAVVRSGTTVTLYMGGTSDGSATSSLNLSGTGALNIGTRGTDRASGLNGNIDEFRYSNIARWTANFTPPTSAYSSFTQVPADPRRRAYLRR